MLLCCCQVVVVASSDWRCAGMTDSVLGCSVGLVEGPVEGENKVYSKLACLFGCHVSATEKIRLPSLVSQYSTVGWSF